MKITFDDESERALLAARLGYGEGVGDADLAASVAAWFDDEPRPATAAARQRLQPSDLEGVHAVADWEGFDDEAGEGGYRSQSTWLGQG
jgi:hypothetical protein